MRPLPLHEETLMSFLLRFCLGLMVLVPSLAYAQPTSSLEIPGNGATVSGVGMISGWKCEAEGDITIRLNGGDPLPATYGLLRADTSGGCGNDGNNGFFSYMNWGILGDGTHTAVAYDAGEEFARSTFKVVTFGGEFLTGASGECHVPDFPHAGTTTTFKWNQAAQHLEADSLEAACRETLTMDPGEACRGSIPLELENSRLGEVRTGFAFSVEAGGRGCIDISGIPALNYCYSVRLPAVLGKIGVSAIKNEDGSWTIDRFPFVDLGPCVVDLPVKPGAQCRGSIDLPLGDIDFTFSVEADGDGCIEAEVDVPLVGDEDIDACFETREAFQKVLDKIDNIIEISAFAAKNADGSWTILDSQ